MQLVPHVTKARTSAAPLIPVTEEHATHALWLFYRAQAAGRHRHPENCRASMLAQQMVGVAVEDAFAPCCRAAESVSTRRRAS